MKVHLENNQLKIYADLGFDTKIKSWKDGVYISLDNTRVYIVLKENVVEQIKKLLADSVISKIEKKEN